MTTTYLYDGLNLVVETTGGVTANYVFGPGIDEPLASYRAGTLSYLAADALGTISETNDTAGNATLSTTFDAWGVTRNEAGTRAHPFMYTAREVGEAGLLFYRARFLQPGVGKFLQEDPNVQELVQTKIRHNLNAPDYLATYPYALNLPILLRDPLGLCPLGGGDKPCKPPKDPCDQPQCNGFQCKACCTQTYQKNVKDCRLAGEAQAMCIAGAASKQEKCLTQCYIDWNQ